MSGNVMWILVAALVLLRIGWRFVGKFKAAKGEAVPTHHKKPLSPWQKKWYTVWVFFAINIRRLFRDRLALFFTFLFPLIFLFVFGSLNSGNKSVSFSVAIINESHSSFSQQFVNQLKQQKTFKVDKTITTFSGADEKMRRGELDATIELPKDFGEVQPGHTYPSGQAIVHYT